MPEIELFASRFDKQLHRYASWMPDPDVLYIDVMSISWENQFVYSFPPFSMIWPVLNKISLESIKALVIAPLWPTQSWFTPRYKSKTSSLSQTETVCSDVHWRSAQTSTIQKETINVLNAAWRDGTKNKYKYIFRRWVKFYSERNYNTMQFNTDIVLEFLTLEYNRCLSYNAIRNVLSAISGYLPHEVRHHNIIKKFMNGAFNLRPLKTQYYAIWEVSILLNYLQNMNTDSDMNKSKKIVCL